MNMKFLKAGLVAAMVVMVTGCGSMSVTEKNSIYGNGQQVAYFAVNGIVKVTAEAGQKEAMSNLGMDLCKEINQNFCTKTYRESTYSVNGNIINSMTLIFKGASFVPNEIKLKHGDIVKIRLTRLMGGNGAVNVGEFLGTANPEQNCHSDGTGIICDDWDYRKDFLQRF